MIDGLSSNQPPVRPALIAHRAGNSPARSRAAQAAGADFVEADVWLYRGRLEVRHEKTMRGVPILWDRWMLAPAWAPRVLLDDVLRALGPETGVLLDLKGNDRRLPDALLEAVATETRPLAVCSPNWRLVDAFAEDGRITRVHSAGGSRALRALPGHLRGRERAAVSIHHRLLTATSVTTLREVASMIIAWPVNTRAALDDVLHLGVDGVTSDSLELIKEAARGRPVGSCP
jgi:glycerophosphoryl diester phosphodiesterase